MNRLTILLVLFASAIGSSLAQEQIAPAIQPYTICRFDDGLSIVQLDGLPTTPMVRTVQTPSGEKEIVMLAGERIMFAYPNEDFYANVKTEQLDTKNYATEKANLIAQLTSLAADGTVRVEPSLPNMESFELHGLNRLKLEGGVLGTYLLFDDNKHLITTVYLLNGEPGQRRFQTLPEYKKLRDHFLTQYTGCVRVNEKASGRPESEEARPVLGKSKR